MKFNPCQGGNNCTEEGSHCQGCGRSHQEIAETRQLIQSVMQFIEKMDYENVEEFTNFLATTTAWKYRNKPGTLGIPISSPGDNAS